MANDLSASPHTVDTAGATVLVTGPLSVTKVRWVGATTAGHQCVVKDASARIVWESVAAGSNFVESEVNSTSSVWRGYAVTTLGSGRLYIYFE